MDDMTFRTPEREMLAKYGMDYFGNKKALTGSIADTKMDNAR